MNVSTTPPLSKFFFISTVLSSSYQNLKLGLTWTGSSVLEFMNFLYLLSKIQQTKIAVTKI